MQKFTIYYINIYLYFQKKEFNYLKLNISFFYKNFKLVLTFFLRKKTLHNLKLNLFNL